MLVYVVRVCLQPVSDGLLGARRALKLHRNFCSGNMEHRAPEVLNTLRAFLDHSVTEVDIDLTGQAVFEAGVLLWRVLTGTHPLPEYPTRWQTGPLSARVVRYTREDVCILSPATRALLTAAGYDLEIVELCRDALSLEPELRPSLRAFAARLSELCSSDSQLSSSSKAVV